MTPPRLAPDERRAQILGAVVPAILEHGAAVTSRQLAAAAGVAEGTIFRVFGDKESLLRAVAANEACRAYSLDGLEPDAERDLAATVELVLDRIVEGVGSFMRVAFALGPVARDENVHANEAYGGFIVGIARLLEPHRAELRTDPVPAATIISTVAIAASSDWEQPVQPLPPQAALDVLLHGITAKPA